MTAALVILLAAAGASSRMGPGRDKLTEEVAGEPLLRNRARIACATGAAVLVTLPADPPPARLAALAGLDLIARPLADAAEGMAASLRAGAAFAAARGAALMVLPADMPDLTLADLQSLIAAAAAEPDAVHRAASAGGRPGHPVIFPPTLLPDLAHLRGDQGARHLLQESRCPLRLHKLPGDHALTDLDTPEAWAAWRAR